MFVQHNNTYFLLPKLLNIDLFTAKRGRKKQVAISSNKLCRVLYWTLYLGLWFISGWFASGVLDNYFSKKTSFSLDEEITTKRPVITINLQDNSGAYPILNNNIWINYCPSYKLWPFQCLYLDLGENDFFIKEINKTEKVFFGPIGHFSNFRIIPLTNLLEEKASAVIEIYTLKATFNPLVTMILTSLENSLGSPFIKFKDGDYLQYELDKSTYRKFLIKPESYYFLPETSNCQKESYYDCLASELDSFDFNQTSCTKKCIPAMFSYGKNYSNTFCQTPTSDNCALNIFHANNYKVENSFVERVDSKCKHSCTILQYSGLEVRESSEISSPHESTDHRTFMYQLGDTDNKMNAYHEYLIYDSMGMIGSVGGTFGMFIGFSMTGVISSIIEFFKESKIGRKILV